MVLRRNNNDKNRWWLRYTDLKQWWVWKYYDENKEIEAFAMSKICVTKLILQYFEKICHKKYRKMLRY